MLPLEHLLRPDAWTDALDKYGAATRLSTVIYNRSLEPVLGPVHATALFDAASGSDHPLFRECARRCVDEDYARPLRTIERSGIGAIGCRLVVDGELAGAVVAAYAPTTFPAETAVQRFAREGHVPFEPLWRATTGPVSGRTRYRPDYGAEPRHPAWRQRERAQRGVGFWQ